MARLRQSTRRVLVDLHLPDYLQEYHNTHVFLYTYVSRTPVQEHCEGTNERLTDGLPLLL